MSVVELRLPADSAFVATLRLTAASLAARCDLTIDDIDDLRLAVDEASALLLPHASGNVLTAVFTLAPSALSVTVAVATSAALEVARDGFGWAVLDALADSVEVNSEADQTAHQPHQAPAGIRAVSPASGSGQPGRAGADEGHARAAACPTG